MDFKGAALLERGVGAEPQQIYFEIPFQSKLAFFHRFQSHQVFIEMEFNFHIIMAMSSC